MFGVSDMLSGYLGISSAKTLADMMGPRRDLENEELRLKTELLKRQIKSLPYSDTDELEAGWNDDAPSPLGNIAKILTTRYLESETNPIFKVGMYAKSSGPRGISALAKLITK